MKLKDSLVATSLLLIATACHRAPKPVAHEPLAESARLALAKACDSLGSPRVEEPAPGVLVALGYALSNTILIQTPAGNVIVDASTSPERAAAARKDLLALSPGKIVALIYTHSHLDHVGGASVFAEPGTEIWATAPFTSHFLKQYGLFQPIETLRGSRQYGLHVPKETLPCTSIGPLPDMASMLKSGVRLPTHSFTGHETLTFGNVKIELYEAHGETHDELMVWIPAKKVLLPGDNIYRGFPNLYTIRGTTARPVDDWIESLDKMRRLNPDVMIPSHTEPLAGAAKIQETLTAYRDAIQWVRDATVRGANMGLSAETLAENIKLPAQLAAHPYLAETYGQVDWSVRAIYADNLGWFAGEADRLYPMPRTEAVKREIGLMGGPEAVLKAAGAALHGNDLKWAAHLYAKVRDSGLAEGALNDEMLQGLAQTFRLQAVATDNTNGRGYLAETAEELTKHQEPLGLPEPEGDFIRELPLEVFFKRMGVRLKPIDGLDVVETLKFVFADVGKTFWVTVRHGVCEVVDGAEPLPGTPTPIATAKVDSQAWKRLALKQDSLAAVLARGELAVDGSWIDFARFMRRFQIN